MGSGISASFSIVDNGDQGGYFNLMGVLECKLKDVAKVAALVLSAFVLVMAMRTPIAMMGIRVLAGLGRAAINSTLVRVFALMYGAHASAQDTITDECECPSGISGNDKGMKQCWICPASQYPKLISRTKKAKAATNGRKCLPDMSVVELIGIADAFEKLVNARSNEAICWLPEGEGHKVAITSAKGAIRRCWSFIRFK